MLPIPYLTTKFLTGRATQSPLMAKIAVSATAVEEGKTIYFDASGSSGNIKKYSWDFDSRDDVDGDKTGVTASYAYKIPGIYMATLTVTDGDGNQKTDTITLTVVSVTKKIDIIEGPNAKVLSSSTADIWWKTDVESNSSVYYGLSYPSEAVFDSVFSLEHQVTLDGLQQNKKYFYYIKARDKFDNIKTTEVNTFTTAMSAPVTTITTTTSTTTTTTIKPNPTCFDGIQNQGEKETDCGGPCKRCKSDFPWFVVIISTLVIILVVALFFFRNYFSKKDMFKGGKPAVKKKEGIKFPLFGKEKKSSVKIPARKPKIYGKKFPKKIKKIKKTPIELIEYIKNCLSQGFKEDQIRKELLKSGWSQEQIEDAFRQAY